MPFYEFECPSCRHHFERLQKLSDADPADCPECGKSGLRRRVTAPAFRLSGSGWYETDFKKDGDTKAGDGAALGAALHLGHHRTDHLAHVLGAGGARGRQAGGGQRGSRFVNECKT